MYHPRAQVVYNLSVLRREAKFKGVASCLGQVFQEREILAGVFLGADTQVKTETQHVGIGSGRQFTQFGVAGSVVQVYLSAVLSGQAVNKENSDQGEKDGGP